MKSYQFYLFGTYYTVLACTYEGACRAFKKAYGQSALDSATVTSVKAA